MRYLLVLIFVSLTTAASAPALGLVAPLGRIDNARFVQATEELQAVAIDIDVVQLSMEEGISQWQVNTEVRFRNVSSEATTVEIGVLDRTNSSDTTVVYVDGNRVETDGFQPRQDPAYLDHTYDHARLLPLRFALGEEHVVRATVYYEGTVDVMGRTFLELPTHALGLFSGNVTAGRMQLALVGRAIGLQSTLSDAIVYDEPTNEVSWTLRDWSPQIPFRASFSTPWSALLLVAEVEACPNPWEIVRTVSRGHMTGLRTHLSVFDDATLMFCANLPEILHGRPFESERTLAQLAGMTLDRYIPSAGPLAVYRLNPAWDVASLSEAEGIYSRSLRSVLEQRD